MLGSRVDLRSVVGLSLFSGVLSGFLELRNSIDSTMVVGLG